MTQYSTHDFPDRQGALEALESAYARLEKDNQHLREENDLLRQRIDYLIRQLYGSKSEKISPDQLELLLDGDAAKKPDASDAHPASEADKPQPAPAAAARKPRTSRLRKSMEKLPEVQERIVAQEVLADPEKFVKIREERSERLEVTPAVYKRRVLIREVHKRIDQPFEPPITPALPKALLEGSVLSASLLADIQHKKFCLHQPFYRQQVELKRSHGLEISRNMLCHWSRIGADWLEPLYKIQLDRLRACGYLQGDETPVDYLEPGHGKTKQGYFWVIHNPTHGLIYKWHKGRARSCLEKLLYGSQRRFAGHLQCDAYPVYPSLSARQSNIELVACLAHIRRKFEHALRYHPRYSAWVIKQIAKLYAIEARLREDKEQPADNATRREVRQRHARPIHRRLGKTMTAIRALPSVRPSSPLGKALDYALKLWTSHALYLEHGELEIDNNQVENAMRPLKLGAKNWLFIGGEDTGQRSAIVLSFVENIRRHGYCPREYLQWVYERIPRMTNQDDLNTLMPEAWIALKKLQTHCAPAPAKAVGAE